MSFAATDFEFKQRFWVIGGVIFKFGRARRPQQARIRERRGAIWERGRTDNPAERSENDRRVERYALLLMCSGFACIATPMPGNSMS